MDFIIKMKEAMVLLHEACRMNDEWNQCPFCPFVDYCDAIDGAGLGTPDDNEFLEF